MTRLKRLLLIFLIALAVPVQGTAAVAADICMTSGAHDTSAVHTHGHSHHGDVGDSGGAADSAQAGAHCGMAASMPPAIVLAVSAQADAGIEVHPAAEPVRMLSGALDRPPLASSV